MRRSGKKMMLTAALILGFVLSGCGEGGSSRSGQNQNLVENAINQQIASEEGKSDAKNVAENVTEEKKTEAPSTEAVTEAPTETPVTETPSTEAASDYSTETWASLVDKQKEESATVTDEQLMKEIKDSYTSTPDQNVDIDLTVMDSDMVYATVYQMTFVDPEAYVGKTFKASGKITYATSSVTNLYYAYVLIKDALACCSQGVEFECKGYACPGDYPAEGAEIEVIGTFESYTEEGDPYLYTRLANAKMNIISEPEKHEITFEY